MKVYIGIWHIVIIISLCFIQGCMNSPDGNIIFDGSIECSKLSDPDLCLEKLNQESNDINMCGKITDSDLKRSCYNRVLAEIDYDCDCNDVKDDMMKDTCYNVQAKSGVDDSKCELIGSEKKRFDCYVGLSRITKNLAYCEKTVDWQTCVQHMKKKLGVNCESLTKEETKTFCEEIQ